MAFSRPADDFRTLGRTRSPEAAVNDNVSATASQASKKVALTLQRIVMIAWLAILLGLAVEGLILAGRASVGNNPTPAQILVELTETVIWSLFVCAGVGLGIMLARARVALGGLIGLVSAALAVALARGSQKIVATALGVVEKPIIMSALTLGALRALEYGLLGCALAWLAGRRNSRAWHFVLAGALIGIVFGGSITWLMVAVAAATDMVMAPPQIIATALNEMIFPIGCALVVYIAISVGRQLKLVAAE